MPPKFQSSFIPKANMIPEAKPARRRIDLLSFFTKLVFALAILSALGVIGYRYYLTYSIGRMGQELESIRQSIAPQAVSELLDLDNRIVTTQNLLRGHKALSPVFAFLEQNTPKTVRLTDFTYTQDNKGLEVEMRGEARSFSALALESEAIHKSKDFQNPVFSDIRLDQKGNVVFSMRANLSPDFISYQKMIAQLSAKKATTTPAVTATSTSATTTKATTTSATTTKKTP